MLCVGALKTFGYPEFFVPRHRLPRPLPEHTLIQPAAFPDLLGAATEFLARIVERYSTRASIVAWQVEHEAVDPLGVEHSWRLSAAFVAQEVAAVRQADPSRPILMNGFLPASVPVPDTKVRGAAWAAVAAMKSAMAAEPAGHATRNVLIADLPSLVCGLRFVNRRRNAIMDRHICAA